MSLFLPFSRIISRASKPNLELTRIDKTVRRQYQRTETKERAGHGKIERDGRPNKQLDNGCDEEGARRQKVHLDLEVCDGNIEHRTGAKDEDGSAHPG